MALSLAKTLSYYKRHDIQVAIILQAKDKEIAFRFEDFFGKRPEVLNYPQDVLELAKQKMTSLHCSEELWRNPLQLSTSMKKEDLNELRKGWDLVLDIDCHFFEYSRIAAHFTVKALQQDGVKSITAKFSGNKGFHIAVPFEAFPKGIGKASINDLFPEAPRRIAAYITERIRKPLADEILRFEKGSFQNIIKRTGLKGDEITRFEANEFGDKIPKLNVDPFLEIDTLLISSRHLFRMPYSFHEKSELVSVPIDINNILGFEKSMAEPDKVKVQHPFLDRDVSSADAALLLRNALDFAPAKTRIVELDDENQGSSDGKRREYALPEKAIGEENFPPCIKLILEGLEDGRKRSCFALINFLASCGWDYGLIEQRLVKWNEKNHEPLREQYLVGQLRYAKEQRKVLPPPNCSNPNYYKGLQVCKPDELCARIKNPLQYAKRKEERAVRSARQAQPKRRKKEPAADGK
ncbi:MAG: DNA primase small subunit domain-containing protein [archaeon]